MLHVGVQSLVPRNVVYVLWPTFQVVPVFSRTRLDTKMLRRSFGFQQRRQVRAWVEDKIYRHEDMYRTVRGLRMRVFVGIDDVHTMTDSADDRLL